jgi:glycopeptide antibiotics resistance protein
VRRFAWSTALALSILLILYIVTPWRNPQDHSHWARVRWVPFVTPPIRSFDMAANVLLYLPLGYALSGLRRRPSPLHAVAFAAALSLTTEWTQLYSHGRWPSMTDVTCNVTGAWCGAWARGLGRSKSA